ncbi:hypothetical protein ABW19_dt0204575 [Dactylella cylindrospora]|nr:hypothetical protein ABW19_dt0204575 [Dactylella cylindrospora]
MRLYSNSLFKFIACSGLFTGIFAALSDHVEIFQGPRGGCSNVQRAEIESYHQDMLDLLRAGLDGFTDFERRPNAFADPSLTDLFYRQRGALASLTSWFGIIGVDPSPGEGIGIRNRPQSRSQFNYFRDILLETLDFLANGTPLPALPMPDAGRIRIYCGDGFMDIKGPADIYINEVTGLPLTNPDGTNVIMNQIAAFQPHFGEWENGVYTRSDVYYGYDASLRQYFRLELPSANLRPCASDSEAFTFWQAGVIVLCPSSFTRAIDRVLDRNTAPPLPGANTGGTGGTIGNDDSDDGMDDDDSDDSSVAPRSDINDRMARSTNLLHEIFHITMGNNNNLIPSEIYRLDRCLDLPRSPATIHHVRGNPESFVYYCMDAWLSRQARFAYNPAQYITYYQGNAAYI